MRRSFPSRLLAARRMVCVIAGVLIALGGAVVEQAGAVSAAQSTGDALASEQVPPPLAPRHLRVLPAPCAVPNVIGLTLRQARLRLSRAHCWAGRIRRVSARRVGRVVRQRPRAGELRIWRFQVALRVGRR